MSKKITLENVDSSELPEIPVIGEVKQIRFTQDMELVSTLADSDLFMVQAGADLEARPNTITFDLIIKNLSGPIEEGSKKFVTGDEMFKVIGDITLLDTWDNTNIVSSLNSTYVNVRRIEEELRREINRSTGKDERHDEQIANLRQDLTATNELLNQEINRSVAKDKEHDELISGLRDDVDSTSAKLDAEIDRSTAKDAEHDTLLKGLRVDVNANKSAIDSEVARSTARDEAHDTAIAKNASDITTEVNRAKAEEAKIRQEMKTADTNLQNAITAETERATGVEEDLQQQITDLSGSTDDRLDALEALSHEQNTDTGTTSKTFIIDSGNTGAMLKAEGGGLSTRTKGDAGYANFTVQNLVIKGDVTQEGESFITQAERVEVRDNMILINEGETGAGVTAGFAGIEVDRGTEQNFMFGFNESDGMFKIGKEGNMFDVALRQPVGDMTDGMFASWDAATKTFKTTNVIPPTLQLYFKDNNTSIKYSIANNGSLMFMTTGKGWRAFTNDTFTQFSSDASKFYFIGDINVSTGNIYTNLTDLRLSAKTASIVIRDGGSVLNTSLTASSFFRSSDNAEVLYATDITTLTDGMFLSWDETNKKVVTTNKVPIGEKLYIAYDHTYITEGGSDGIEFNTRDAWLRFITGSIETRFTSSANWFLFEGNISTTGKITTTGTNLRLENKSNYLSIGAGASTMNTTLKATTFYRSSDDSEVLYQADLKSVLTGKETNYAPTVKAVSDAIDAVSTGTTESLKNYLKLSGGNMTGPILMDNNIQIQSKSSNGDTKRLISKYPNNGTYVGDIDGVLSLYSSSSDIIHSRNGTTYRVLDEYNLPDPATKSGDNAFTGTNSFVGGKFSVAGLESKFYVSANGSLESRSTYANTSWLRSLEFSDNDVVVGRFGVSVTTKDNVPTTDFVGILVGDGTVRNSQYKFYSESLDLNTIFRIDFGNASAISTNESTIIFGSNKRNSYIRSNDSDLFHTKNNTNYKIWDASNLPTPASVSDIPDVSDMAKRSEANTFTASNTFTAGQFSVGDLSIDAYNNMIVDLGVMDGKSPWTRYLYFKSDDGDKGLAFGAFASLDGQTNFAFINVGDKNYNAAQYKFYSDKLYVPSSWELVDSGTDTSIILYNNANSQHLGRGIGVTYVRSGNSDLYHTKDYTNYKILDESNYSQYLPTTSKWTYGFVGVNVTSELFDLNTGLQGADKPKAIYSYTSSTLLSNAPTSSSYGSVWQLWNSGQTDAQSLNPQLFFDVNHNVENGTRYMYFRTSNNKGFGDSSNWKRVLTADENVASLVMDKNTYPSIARIDGTTYMWLRTPTHGLLPDTPVTLANGGISYLGTSYWSFQRAYISNVYANNYYFGSSGTYLSGDANYAGILNNGRAKGMKVGSLLVSSNYASTTLVPTNGIFSSGIIQSNDSMLVGYSGNVTDGMLGYGLYYDGTFAQGLGSEYSSGALVLYKMLNPNNGKAGYNVPRATTGIPTYLKITNGTVKLGVGVNKTYTAGEAVTVTEHTLATLDAVNTKLGSYLPLTGGTLTGQTTISANVAAPLVLNYKVSGGTDCYMRFVLNETASGAVGVLSSSGTYLYHYPSNKYLFLRGDGVYFGAAGSDAKLLTSADLSSYATQSWVTSQAYYKLNSTSPQFRGSIIIDAEATTGGWSRNLWIGQNSSNGDTGVSFGGYGGGSTPIYAYVGVGTNRGYNATNSLKVYIDKVTFGNKTLATVDQIPSLSGYATQSWVTSQGYLKSHQTIYALTFAAGAFAAKTFTPTSAAVTVNVPTKTSHLINDSGFLRSVPSTYATQSWVTSQGYLTSITKSMVTTALGYTPPTTNTTYSQATSSTLGLVKIGATGLASKNYAVQLNSSGQMYVAVPWTDTNTTYSAATSSTYGLVKIGATGLASKNYAVQLNSSGQMYVAVPWTDTDTNTHYTTRLYVGASGTAATAAASNPYLKVTDDNTYRNQVRFVGAGATTVASDASGNITITSTNTTYSLATSSSNGLMSSSQYTKLSNCIETVSATDMVTSVQVVGTIPASSSQVTGRLYLKFA